MRSLSRVWGMVAVGVMTVTVGAAQLAAQGEAGFQPVKPGDLVQEHLPATPLVFAAYAVVWVTLVLYVLSLWRRIAKAEREVAVVAAKLESRH